MISLDCDDLFDTWRQQARWLLSHSIDPSRVSWSGTVSYTHLTLPTKRIV